MLAFLQTLLPAGRPQLQSLWGDERERGRPNLSLLAATLEAGVRVGVTETNRSFYGACGGETCAVHTICLVDLNSPTWEWRARQRCLK